MECSYSISLMMVLIFTVVFTSVGIINHINSIIDFRIGGIVTYCSLIVLNYNLFIKNKKYKQFENEFNQLSKANQKKQYLIGILISVSGYVVPIALIVLIMKFL